MDLDAALWLRRFDHKPQAAQQLVCFPHAGGAASYFRPLADALGATIAVRAIQYPGRQDRRREPGVGSIAELADAIVAVLGEAALSEPTVFFGHSMGAILAFEVIRRYERDRGRAPMGLIASGRRAPSIVKVEDLHTRSDDAVVEEMRRLNGTDVSFLDDPDVQAMIMPAIRSDYRAIEGYRWDGGPPVTAPIHAFVGTADPRVTVGDAAAWQQHTASDFVLRTFPSGHFYLSEIPPTRLAAEVERSVTSFAATAAVSRSR